MAGRRYYRDELGRFAPPPRIYRDEQGRFAEPPRKKRPPVRKEPVRKKRPPVQKEPVRKKRPPVRKEPVRKKRPPVQKEPARKKRPPVRKEPVRKKKPLVRKKPVRKKRPLVRKEPVLKKKPPRKKKRPTELPRVAEASRAAEAEMQGRLLALQESIALLQGGLDMSVKTFVNLDGTVDGELRIGNLPDEWRSLRGVRLLVATLSNAVRSVPMFQKVPSMGGSYWISFAVRFGPRNMDEVAKLSRLYKRHRGMLQIGTYPTQAWLMGSQQVALTADSTGLKAMLTALLEKRGMPPTAILVRYIWTPYTERPGHYKGEK
jgi:hypothetical protein